MAHAARSLLVLLAAVLAGPSVLVSPSPAAAATTCAPADPFQAGTLTTAAATPQARFGEATATGDFNGDHIADLAIGASGDGAQRDGVVTVLLGSAAGPGVPVRLSQAGLSGQTGRAGDRFGAALAAGDFDGDGRDDLAVGIPEKNSGAGLVGLFRGTGDGLTTGRAITQEFGGEVSEAGDRFGSALAAADFDANGLADLAIGADRETLSRMTQPSGRVMVLNGDTTAGLRRGRLIEQTAAGGTDQAGDRFGAVLATGDAIGDRRTDLIVGAPDKNLGTDVDTGAIYVLDAAGNRPGTNFFRGQGGSADETGDRFGSAIAVADLDGDGDADIAVGAPLETYAAGVVRGSVLVLPGPVTRTSTGTAVPPAEPAGTNDRWGAALAAGQLDSEPEHAVEVADLVVGAPGTGVVAIHHGVPGGAPRLDRVLTQADVGAAVTTGSGFGSTLAIGDLDGDRRTDAVVGAPAAAQGGTAGRGAAYLLDDLSPGTARPIERYAPIAFEQSVAFSSGRPSLRWAFVDNIGRPILAAQEDPADPETAQVRRDGPAAALTGEPAVVQGADHRFTVAARSTVGDVWVRTELAADAAVPAWGPWRNLGGPELTGLTAVRADSGIVLAGIGNRGELVVLRQRADGSFGTWERTGAGDLTGSPVAVPMPGGFQVFATDADGQVHTVRYQNGRSSPCTVVGDRPITGRLAALTYPGSRSLLLATAGDELLTLGATDAGVEPSWATAAAGVSGSPTAGVAGTGHLHVGARGPDGTIRAVTEVAPLTREFGAWHPLTTITARTDPAGLGVVGDEHVWFAFLDDQEQLRMVDHTGRLAPPVQ